uniref:Serpentine receptor class gamma n=1 Tax=Caenorhabditis tropicalis TaxID=1561998 RepID=A0A1I7UBE9_9PELO
MTNATIVDPLSVKIVGSLEDVKPDFRVQVFTIIQFAYGLPTYILIASFFVLMCFGKKYSNSFYRLVQLDLMVNFVCYTNTWFAVRLDKHPEAIPFLKALTYFFPTFLTWTRYFAYWFMHMQFVSAIVLSVHRMTSVIFHSTYEKMWNRFFLGFVILCIVYCYLCNSLIPGFISEVYIQNGTLMRSLYPGVIKIASDNNGFFAFAYFILLFVVGIWTSRMVTKKIQAASLSSGSIGRKLSKIAVTYGFIYSGIMCWSVVGALNSNFNFFPDLVSKFSSYALPFVSDLMTLALPYILMIYDTNVQRDVWNKTFGSKATSRVSSTFIITN